MKNFLPNQKLTYRHFCLKIPRVLDETPCSQAIGLIRQSYASWRNSRSSFLWYTTRSAVKNHIPSEMAKELIAIFRTVYHLWFLVCQRVLPQLHLHLLLHHFHHRSQHRPTEIQYRRTDTPKIQYQKEVEVWVESFGETRCMSPQKPKTLKNGNQKKYKEIYRMNCVIGYWNSWRIWLMKALQKSFGETPEQGQDTSKSSHELLMEPRAKVEPCSGKQCIYALSEGSELWHLLEDENNNVFLLKTCWYSRAQSRTFWWLGYSGSQNPQWRKWIAEQSSTCRGGTWLGNTVDTIIPV